MLSIGAKAFEAPEVSASVRDELESAAILHANTLDELRGATSDFLTS